MIIIDVQTQKLLLFFNDFPWILIDCHSASINLLMQLPHNAVHMKSFKLKFILVLSIDVHYVTCCDIRTVVLSKSQLRYSDHIASMHLLTFNISTSSIKPFRNAYMSRDQIYLISWHHKARVWLRVHMYFKVKTERKTKVRYKTAVTRVSDVSYEPFVKISCEIPLTWIYNVY